MSEHHDDNISTGRTPRPADSVAGVSKTPRAFESVTVLAQDPAKDKSPEMAPSPA